MHMGRWSRLMAYCKAGMASQTGDVAYGLDYTFPLQGNPRQRVAIFLGLTRFPDKLQLSEIGSNAIPRPKLKDTPMVACGEVRLLMVRHRGPILRDERPVLALAVHQDVGVKRAYAWGARHPHAEDINRRIVAV